MNRRTFLFTAINITLPLVLISVAHAQVGNCNGSLCSPLSGTFTNITSLVTAILGVVVKISLPIITCAFVYVGFLYTFAQGRVPQIEKAHRAALYTIIGAVILLGITLIWTILSGSVNQLYGQQ